MKLGESLDVGFCSGFEETCNRVINKSKVVYCSKHREKLLQARRNGRQEFAIGNSSLREGVPMNLNQKKSGIRDVSNHATYRIGSETVVAEGLKVKLLSPLKPTVQSANAKEIQTILNSNLPAAKNIRIMFGVEEKELDPANLQVFGPNLLKKMGGNPFLRDDLQLTPTKASPQKTQDGASPSTPSHTNRLLPKREVINDSPIYKRKRVDSDSSDIELEIQ
jgi:hypothetical protein